MKSNIFSVLDKYNSATNENYLTEAFVYVLNYLLQNDKCLLIYLLNSILVESNDFQFNEHDNIRITTQDNFPEYGRPDIKIETENIYLLIEVKFDSGLGNLQIERYNEILCKSNKKFNKLILLTRHLIDIPPENIQPYKKIRWFNVHKMMLNMNSKNETCNYLINSFNSFLEEKKMSVNKVSWEYENGIKALNNFVSMLEVSLTSNNFTKLARSAGALWNGFFFYSGNQRYWSGIRYENPIEFIFQVIDGNAPTKEYKKNLEEVHFFSLNSDEQLLALVKIINDYIALN